MRTLVQLSRILILTLLLTLVCVSAPADDAARVKYIANTGLMIESGEARVLFDPLFLYPHDYYQRIPPDMKEAIIAGTGEFAGVDAVFISHYHADHFSPSMILELLRVQQDLVLVAPGQAVSALHREAENGDESLFERIRTVNVGYREPPVSITLEDISVEVIMIPHAGWPNRHQNVENLSYRVTLDDQVTVVHMGDADPKVEHFHDHETHWSSRHVHGAFPPYWFFSGEQGRQSLEAFVKPDMAIGVHIPADPADRPADFHGYEVFDTPGESRSMVTGAELGSE